MPQIWLTYDELGELMDCDAAAARSIAATLPLDRRRSRDGNTRAKLSPTLSAMFLDRESRGHPDRAHETLVAAAPNDANIAQLRAVYEQMARFSSVPGFSTLDQMEAASG